MIKKNNTAKISIDTQINTMVKAMDEKKAQEITVVDLTGINGASFDYFIISHADSTTQVHSIADSVEDTMRKDLSLKPYHTEGYTNSEWILLDFGNVVAHIFQTEIRSHYELERLWADANITVMDEKMLKKIAGVTEPTTKKTAPKKVAAASKSTASKKVKETEIKPAAETKNKTKTNKKTEKTNATTKRKKEN